MGSIPQGAYEDPRNCNSSSNPCPSLRKLIHHRKETLSRRGPSAPSPAAMTSSTSDHHLDTAAARQPNGVCRAGFERQHSLPSSEYLGADGGLYQVHGENILGKGGGWGLRLCPEAQRVHLVSDAAWDHSPAHARSSGP